MNFLYDYRRAEGEKHTLASYLASPLPPQNTCKVANDT